MTAGPRLEHLFGDLRPFAQCHAASLVALSGGRMRVAWFGGMREGSGDVSIWSALRNPEIEPTHPHARRPGEGWSEASRIARVADEPHWNPVLFATAEDELVLHFKVGKRIRTWRTYASRSVDAGQTWTRPHELITGDRGGRGAVKNKPIELASGDWLAGASTEGLRGWRAFVDRSPNGWDGWEATEAIALDQRLVPGKGVIQPTLWESTPGQVHMLLRSTGGQICRSDSDDDGYTWSPARPTALPNNNSGLDLARLPDGTLALACNPVAGNWAARTPLSILFSRDNGETWPQRIDIETDPGEFSYPAIIPFADGLAVAYTWNRRRIAVARIDPGRETDGEPF